MSPPTGLLVAGWLRYFCARSEVGITISATDKESLYECTELAFSDVGGSRDCVADCGEFWNCTTDIPKTATGDSRCTERTGAAGRLGESCARLCASGSGQPVSIHFRSCAADAAFGRDPHQSEVQQPASRSDFHEFRFEENLRCRRDAGGVARQCQTEHRAGMEPGR